MRENPGFSFSFFFREATRVLFPSRRRAPGCPPLVERIFYGKKKKVSPFSLPFFLEIDRFLFLPFLIVPQF